MWQPETEEERKPRAYACAKGKGGCCASARFTSLLMYLRRPLVFLGVCRFPFGLSSWRRIQPRGCGIRGHERGVYLRISRLSLSHGAFPLTPADLFDAGSEAMIPRIGGLVDC